MIARDAIVTLESIEGFRVVKLLGYVRGQALRPRDVLRATFRSIGAFIGLAPIEYLTEAEKAREEALEMLRKHADAMGANGVINVRFQTSDGTDGTKVLCFGQAVILEPKP